MDQKQLIIDLVQKDKFPQEIQEILTEEYGRHAYRCPQFTNGVLVWLRDIKT